MDENFNPRSRLRNLYGTVDRLQSEWFELWTVFPPNEPAEHVFSRDDDLKVQKVIRYEWPVFIFIPQSVRTIYWNYAKKKKY